ncbi:MAG: DUF885 domain-containing protein [Blautia sp.]|nr:DUF885 domain-containing protein [Blautia sp.]MDY5665065.1 DUF885 domain-containing protein [Blautia sp.]
MFSKLSKTKKVVSVAFLLSFVLIFGISIGYLTNHVFSENGKFESFTEEIFKNEVSGSTLTLHYALANPEKQGITRSRATLGTVFSDINESQKLCQQYEDKLKSFSYSRLSRENRLTLDMLLLYFHTQNFLGDNYFLEEPLGPSLGIQAQLPVLLAEYAFYKDQDITDYLNLLSDVDSYFKSILEFEQQKAQAGYFMSDATLDRILKQCSDFIKDPESNYMLEIFQQKLEDYGKLSEADQQILIDKHKEILLNKVIPAYQMLMDGLEKLRGTGTNDRGLAYFEGGKDYYQYLLQSTAGIYAPVKQLEQRLTSQLLADSKEISLMLREQPSLLTKLTGGVDLPDMEPETIVKSLQTQISEDFPETEAASYEIRYVHKSMEKYLSPAFYLTPPLDTGSPNVIYINQDGRSSNLELFTTLAHEGFPGHLYQTVFFGRQNPSHIRYLIDSSGYVEGWATYVESYAYRYAAKYVDDEAATDVTRLAWLNRSVNLCIYSLLDIGIHYRGWTQEKAAEFLNVFGIRSASVVSEIYRYIVETPVNYVKYYLGCLNFMDLRDNQKELLGDDFDLKDFHRKILEIGPVQFPVLEKYMQES